MSALKIGHLTYSVDRIQFEDEHGQHNGGLKQISIAPCCANDRAVATLIHEVMHAIFEATAWSEKDGVLEEETICTFIGNGLAQVFLDNNMFDMNVVNQILGE